VQPISPGSQGRPIERPNVHSVQMPGSPPKSALQMPMTQFGSFNAFSSVSAPSESAQPAPVEVAPAQAAPAKEAAPTPATATPATATSIAQQPRAGGIPALSSASTTPAAAAGLGATAGMMSGSFGGDGSWGIPGSFPQGPANGMGYGGAPGGFMGMPAMGMPMGMPMPGFDGASDRSMQYGMSEGFSGSTYGQQGRGDNAQGRDTTHGGSQGNSYGSQGRHDSKFNQRSAPQRGSTDSTSTASTAPAESGSSQSPHMQQNAGFAMQMPYGAPPGMHFSMPPPGYHYGVGAGTPYYPGGMPQTFNPSGAQFGSKTGYQGIAGMNGFQQQSNFVQPGGSSTSQGQFDEQEGGQGRFGSKQSTSFDPQQQQAPQQQQQAQQQQAQQPQQAQAPQQQQAYQSGKTSQSGGSSAPGSSNFASGTGDDMSQSQFSNAGAGTMYGYGAGGPQMQAFGGAHMMQPAQAFGQRQPQQQQYMGGQSYGNWQTNS